MNKQSLKLTFAAAVSLMPSDVVRVNFNPSNSIHETEGATMPLARVDAPSMTTASPGAAARRLGKPSAPLLSAASVTVSAYTLSATRIVAFDVLVKAALSTAAWMVV